MTLLVAIAVTAGPQDWHRYHIVIAATFLLAAVLAWILTRKPR